MLARRVAPAEAYRQVDFEARVYGASRQELVAICFEQLIGSLGTAIYAKRMGDAYLSSRSMSRAVSSLLALEMGISGDDGLAGAMRDLYQGARNSIIGCSVNYDEKILQTIRKDFVEIWQAMSGQVS